MCKFFLFVTLLIMPSGSFASLSPSEIQAKIASLSPMPEKPNIHGSRFQYYHLLENVRKSIEGWLNPSHSEDYLYRDIPSLAMDTSDEFLAHIKLYERLLQDYETLLTTGEIDLYSSSSLGGGWSHGGEVPFPDHYGLPFEVAKKLYMHSFNTHYEFAKLLTILHKQLWDHRYISEFMFSITVHPEHRPLESISSLSKSSLKSQMLLEQIIRRFRQVISEVSLSFVTLSAKILNGDIDNDLISTLHKTEFKSEELKHRLTYLKNSLYRAVQFANDIVRDKSTDISYLESIAANLGDQLRESINDISTFREELKENDHVNGVVPQRRNSVEDRLTDTYEELIEILGLRKHIMGVTLYADLKLANPELPYQMFRDTVTLQYILAMGSAMAKISETVDGRGNWHQRLSQEFSFRLAQLQGSNATRSSLVVISNHDPKISQIQRRDFAAPELASRREGIENKLWQIFFRHAQLDFDSPLNCDQLLIPRPPIKPEDPN